MRVLVHVWRHKEAAAGLEAGAEREDHGHAAVGEAADEPNALPLFLVACVCLRPVGKDGDAKAPGVCQVVAAVRHQRHRVHAHAKDHLCYREAQDDDAHDRKPLARRDLLRPIAPAHRSGGSPARPGHVRHARTCAWQQRRAAGHLLQGPDEAPPRENTPAWLQRCGWPGQRSTSSLQTPAFPAR